MEYSGEVIADLLHEVNKDLRELIHDSLDQEKTPFVTLILLKHIRQHPGITVSELARLSGLAKSHVSRQLDSLANQGWVEKREDPNDQRILRLYVTERSIAFHNEMRSKVRTATADVLNAVPPMARDSLVKGLLALRAALNQEKDKQRQR